MIEEIAEQDWVRKTEVATSGFIVLCSLRYLSASAAGRFLMP